MHLYNRENLADALRPENFIWASGIEHTFVPQVKPGQRALDEYQLMGHYEHWRTVTGSSRLHTIVLTWACTAGAKMVRAGKRPRWRTNTAA